VKRASDRHQSFNANLRASHRAVSKADHPRITPVRFDVDRIEMLGTKSPSSRSRPLPASLHRTDLVNGNHQLDALSKPFTWLHDSSSITGMWLLFL
jgi:hypothetical protein